jgi:hypothetical protein
VIRHVHAGHLHHEFLAHPTRRSDASIVDADLQAHEAFDAVAEVHDRAAVGRAVDRAPELPAGRELSRSGHGSSLTCFSPVDPAMFLVVDRITTSTVSPFLGTSLSATRFVHDMSDTCTSPSMPSSSSRTRRNSSGCRPCRARAARRILLVEREPRIGLHLLLQAGIFSFLSTFSDGLDDVPMLTTFDGCRTCRVHDISDTWISLRRPSQLDECAVVGDRTTRPLMRSPTFFSSTPSTDTPRLLQAERMRSFSGSVQHLHADAVADLHGSEGCAQPTTCP